MQSILTDEDVRKVIMEDISFTSDVDVQKSLVHVNVFWANYGQFKSFEIDLSGIVEKIKKDKEG
jgi:hypothetical protein